MNSIMKIGNQSFDLHRHTYVMGILNVTPDSFSDGGSYRHMDDVLRRVEEMIAEGAHVIDVGGESTRPGYTMISVEEEIDRVAPVVEQITQRFDIPVSVDTYKYKVADAVLKSGAHMINDIWGLQNVDDENQQMAQVIAKYQAVCCLMHNQSHTIYQQLIPDCIRFLKRSTDIALIFAIISVFIASIYSLISLDNAKRLVDSGLDRSYEWYAAFGIVITSIWLFLEIFELLIKFTIFLKVCSS